MDPITTFCKVVFYVAVWLAAWRLVLRTRLYRRLEAAWERRRRLHARAWSMTHLPGCRCMIRHPQYTGWPPLCLLEQAREEIERAELRGELATQIIAAGGKPPPETVIDLRERARQREHSAPGGDAA